MYIIQLSNIILSFIKTTLLFVVLVEQTINFRYEKFKFNLLNNKLFILL